MLRSQDIEVVLPTYNGEQFLEAQLNSIYNQTLRPIRVLLRDDCSADSTIQIINSLQDKYGNWLHRLPSDENLGCVGNINKLLESSSSSYIALSDQDDIWLPHKLEKSFAQIQYLENIYTSSTPLLVHCDLDLVDQYGAYLQSSFLQRQRLNPKRICLKDLALTNVVTGCTSLFNRSLLQIALPIPSTAMMHDWWLALVASSFGYISFLDESLVLYRQHGTNVIGSQGLGINYWLNNVWKLAHMNSSEIPLYSVLRQYQTFQKRYSLNSDSFLNLLTIERTKRFQALLKVPFSRWPCKHGMLRSIGLYILLFTLPIATCDNL